jgi:hypothetical protein
MFLLSSPLLPFLFLFSSKYLSLLLLFTSPFSSFLLLNGEREEDKGKRGEKIESRIKRTAKTYNFFPEFCTVSTATRYRYYGYFSSNYFEYRHSFAYTSR